MNQDLARTFCNVAVTLIALCVCSLPTQAADGGCPRDAAAGPTQDVEGGAVLTASSHKAGAGKRFELMDANHDGKVTSEEISSSRGAESIAWASKMTSARDKMAQLDTNKDGVLTPKEYAESSQSMFNRLDVDHDGTLSEDEMIKPFAGR